MRLVLKTKVNGNYKDVISNFDRKLFEALAPKFGKIKIVEFTGSKKGDVVHLQFLSPFRTEWISDITSDGIDTEKAFFIDEGRVLPPGLKKWKHQHIVKKLSAEESEIIDDIYYQGLHPILSILMYPFLWFAFYPRKAIYKQYFTNF